MVLAVRLGRGRSCLGVAGESGGCFSCRAAVQGSVAASSAVAPYSFLVFLLVAPVSQCSSVDLPAAQILNIKYIRSAATSALCHSQGANSQTVTLLFL